MKLLSKITFLIITICLSFPFLPALAQDSMTLTITPPLIKVNMLPGEVWSSSIKVINNNEHAIKLYTNVLDFKSGPDGGVEFLQDVYNNEVDPEIYKRYRLSQWIEIQEEPIELEAQGSMQIPFTIRLPEDAEPGGHYAAVLTGTKPDEEVSGSAIKISSLLASLVMLNIKGEVVERGSIREFSTNKKYHREADVDFAVRFENTGNIHLLPQGSITIYDMFDNLRTSISINGATEFGSVLPESVRAWNFKWTSNRGLLDTGRYKAMLILTYGDEAKETVNQTLYFWVIDYYYLGSILGGLLLLIIIIVLLMRFYIRRAIRTTQGEAGYIMQPTETKRGGVSVIPKSSNGVDLRASVKNKPASSAETESSISGWALLKRYFILSIFLVAVIGGAIFYFSNKKDKQVVVDEIERTENTNGGFTVLPPDEEGDKDKKKDEKEVAIIDEISTTTDTEKVSTSSEEVATSTENEVAEEDEEEKFDFESINIKVLNGSGIAGAAGEASDALEHVGFKVSSTGNADSFNYTDTVIKYNKKYEREAEYITDLINGAVEMESFEEESDEIIVIIGKSFK